jgi:flagellin
MTSILTNVAANTALLNLQNTVQNLQDIQNQISTGLRVSSAADNAAYYSIATVLRSDSGALSTVSDALNLGGSSLDVASSALKQVNTVLSDIKQKLLSATSPGVDRKKIQESITQDQQQLKNIANSANFNGQNFLSVNTGETGYNATKEFISSFSRDAAGSISVGTIAVNVATTALFDSGYSGTTASAAAGVTPPTADLTDATGGNLSAADGTHLSTFTVAAAETALGALVPAVVSSTINATNGSVASTLNSDGTLNVYSFTADSGVALNANVIANQFTITGANIGTTVSMSKVAGATTLQTGDTAGAIATSSDYKTTTSGNTLTFYVAQVSDSTDNTDATVQYYKYTVSGLNGGVLDSVDNSTVGSYTDANGNVTRSPSTGTGMSIFNMSIASLSDSASDQAMLNAYQQQVDAAISNVTASASAIGTARSRITSQSSFVSSLQMSLNNGIGSLVDADLNTASTRLQALQVQQQLGVQSLSIANQSTQAILKLFQ